MTVSVLCLHISADVMSVFFAPSASTQHNDCNTTSS